MKIKAPERVGVFAIDPGGTTGLGVTICTCWPTVAETLQHASVRTYEIKGDWEEQARELRDRWVKFKTYCANKGLGDDEIMCVREDFNLYKFRSSDKRGVYPIWISAMFMGLIDHEGVKVYSQTPTEAKRFATNERLHRWGVYIQGSEHERDVTRHIALRLNRIL